MSTISDVTNRVSATMTVEAAAELAGISRTTAYAEAQRYRDSGGAHGLPNVKLGRRVLVLTARIADLLQLDPVINHSVTTDVLTGGATDPAT